MSCIGVFGGTFDPIHYGHLRSAYEVLQFFSLQEVRFIPCGDPPHRGSTFAPAAERFAMVEAAISDQPGFVIDDREMTRDGPSYSIDTLESLRQEFPDKPLALLIGMDAFLGLAHWHRWAEILDNAHMIVAHRPGWIAPRSGVLGELIQRSGSRQVEHLHTLSSGRLFIHAVTQLEIASTDIRSLIADGGDPRYLVPDTVRDRIAGSGCYGDLHNGS